MLPLTGQLLNFPSNLVSTRDQPGVQAVTDPVNGFRAHGVAAKRLIRLAASCRAAARGQVFRMRLPHPGALAEGVGAIAGPGITHGI